MVGTDGDRARQSLDDLRQASRREQLETELATTVTPNALQL
jgi:hypothetical protein